MSAVIDLTHDAPAPEFLLRNAIDSGFQTFVDNPELIDSLFAAYGDDVIAEVKSYLIARNDPAGPGSADSGKSTVKTSINYPKDGFSLPHVAIVMGMDAEQSQYDAIGDAFDFRENESNTQVTVIRGIMTEAQYSLMIMSQHSNLTVYLYILVKAIIIMNSIEFHKRGMQNIMLTGRDLTLDQNLFPEFAYGRQLVVKCLNHFKIPDDVSSVVVTNFVGTTTFIDC